MKKFTIIGWIVKVVMGLIALGVGIWYLSSSISGGAITYTSTQNFLATIGVENGDIASANGCFLCGYISNLLAAIGSAAETFWEKILESLLVLIAIGFGIYIVYTGIAHVWDATKKTAGTKIEEKKIEFKPWFDKIWKQGIRVFFVSALLGSALLGGTDVLAILTRVVIEPILYFGGILGMAASGIAESATCAMTPESSELLVPVMGPFMCVVGNINSVVLAGAAGGFSLMNYAWMGMGGGLFTWISGLGLVILFLVVGFDLFFQILSVMFKLIFLIIFLPIFIASQAFEGGWKLANGLLNKGIDMIINAAIKTVVIALKTTILFATVSYATDLYYPGPVDGYSAVLPPILGQAPDNPDAQTMSVMNVFAECESVALADGVMDKDAFKACYDTKRASVEQRYPNAFDFMKNGWDFLMMMIMLGALYFIVLRNRIEKMLAPVGKESFDFGGELKKLGKSIWSLPTQIIGKIGKTLN